MKTPVKKSFKKNFPVSDARQILEPGPIVLVGSAYQGKQNLMTMGWHTIMEFTPSLFGCIIAGSNHSFDMIRKSKECTINVPTADMAKTVVRIGNCSGDDIDKFAKFKLTAVKADKVKAPLVGECFANFECRLVDGKLIDKYNFFIFEIIKAHVAHTPRNPKTLHYHGKGVFTVSGKSLNLRPLFTKWPN